MKFLLLGFVAVIALSLSVWAARTRHQQRALLDERRERRRLRDRNWFVLNLFYRNRATPRLTYQRRRD